MIGIYLSILRLYMQGDPKVDQSTANRIATIKVLVPAIMALIVTLSIVALAWFRDGDYARVITSQFPAILIACLATLGVLRVTDVVGSILQTKYTGQPNTVPPSGPEVSAPPVNSSNGTLGTAGTNGTGTHGPNGVNGTPAPIAAPVSPLAALPQDPAAGA